MSYFEDQYDEGSDFEDDDEICDQCGEFISDCECDDYYDLDDDRMDIDEDEEDDN